MAISSRYLLRLGGVILEVLVRVVLQSEAAVGALDVIVSGRLRDAERLVEVLDLGRPKVPVLLEILECLMPSENLLPASLSVRMLASVVHAALLLLSH